MKIVFSFFLSLTLILGSLVKKKYLPYGVIALKADLIVYGKISNILKNKDVYQLNVIDSIKGESEKIINVKFWQEWSCDKRIKKLSVNQELVLFLLKKEKNEYEIIHGSSGELFVSENNQVYTFLNTDFPNIYELKKGIKLFNRAYKYYGKLYDFNDEGYFKRTANSFMVKKLIKENEFFRMAHKSISEYKIKL